MSSTQRTYTLRQKVLVHTNTPIVPMPGRSAFIGADGCVRGVDAELAERMIAGGSSNWEIVGGGSAGLAFERAAKVYRSASEAFHKATNDVREAGCAAYMAGMGLKDLAAHMAPPGDRDPADWEWVAFNADGVLPEVTGDAEPPLAPVVESAHATHVGAPSPMPADLHATKWDASLSRFDAPETEGERRAREFGFSLPDRQQQPSDAKRARQPDAREPDGYQVTTGARRGNPLPPDDVEPAPAQPEAAPAQPEMVPEPMPEQPAPAPAADAASVEVAARLEAMSPRAVGALAREMGADLPDRGVGAAAREFLASQPADAVAAALDARLADKE